MPVPAPVSVERLGGSVQTCQRERQRARPRVLVRRARHVTNPCGRLGEAARRDAAHTDDDRRRCPAVAVVTAPEGSACHGPRQAWAAAFGTGGGAGPTTG